MKFYTEEEILDKHIGKKGTPKRDQFEIITLFNAPRLGDVSINTKS